MSMKLFDFISRHEKKNDVGLTFMKKREIDYDTLDYEYDEFDDYDEDMDEEDYHNYDDYE